MVVVCTSHFQARKLQVLCSYLQMICELNLPLNGLLRALDKLKQNEVVGTLLNETHEYYYPCLSCNNGRQAIYSKW